MKWRYFAGAAMLAAYLMLSTGVPPIAVAGGIIFAGLLNLRKNSLSII